jgi:hypothetical protein
MPKLENNETPKPVKTEFQNCGPTICVNWIFHRNTEPGSSSANIWYNHLCHAVAREPGIDFVTGERGFKTRNDLGQLYVSDQEFEYCRDIRLLAKLGSIFELHIIDGGDEVNAKAEATAA